MNANARKNLRIIIVLLALMTVAAMPVLVRERISIMAREDVWVIEGADLLMSSGDLSGGNFDTDTQTIGLYGDVGHVNVAAPTSIASATPVVLIDSDGLSNLLEVRDAGTPVWTINNGGGVVQVGAATYSGGVTVNNWVKVAAPTSIATATPAMVVDSLGVSVLLEIRDAATPVAAFYNGGGVKVSAPTAIATAVPAMVVDSLGVSNLFEVRDGATPAVQVYNGGGARISAPTAIATAVPALIVDSLGVSVLFEVRDAATPVFAVNNGGAVDATGNLADSGGAFTIADNTVIDGATDAVQLIVQGNGTQTSDLVRLQDSTSTNVLAVTNAGNTTITGTLGVGGKATVSDAVLVDGDADEEQLTVQGHSTQNTQAVVIEQSDSTRVFTVDNSGNTAITGTTTIEGLATINDAALIDGDADEVQLRVQGHSTQNTPLAWFQTSAGVNVFSIDNSGNTIITGTLDAVGDISDSGGNVTVADDLDVTGDTTLSGYLSQSINTENVMLPTILSVPITYTAAAGGNGVVATIADGEIWFVHSVFIRTTTNFDCTGDDATLIIGDDLDTDGFIAAADAALQATFTEETGYAAGWYGIENGSGGAYTLDDGGPFIYAPSGSAQTIDWVVDEGDGETLTAGAATIYVVYTRIQ